MHGSRAIGVMGGTFDPIHYGHLVAAEAARTCFGLSEVIFVPSGNPPHKADRSVSTPEHRFLMTVLATTTNPYFRVSRVEIDRPGPSYTVDTIEALRERLEADARVYFITGADAVMEMMTWNRPEAILQMCELIAATRPGYPPADIRRLRKAIPEANAKRVHTIEVPALAISSSDIRARVAQGKPIKYLVPETVEHYILKSGLYGGQQIVGTGGGPLSGFWRR